MKTLKYILRHEWYNVILLVLPFVAIPFLRDQLPAQMAFHWSMSGHADHFANNSLVLILIPTLNLLLYFTILQQARAQQNSKPVLRSAITFVLLVIHVWIILLNMGIVNSIIDLMSPLTAAILILSGFYLQKKFPLDLIGILPWTLDDQKNLQKKNRFTAYSWILGGFLILILFPFTNEKTRIDMLVITVMNIALLPIFYSFYLYKFNP